MKTMKKLVKHPVSSIGSVYRTRRDLHQVTVGPELLGNCNLPMELVEILVDLYGAIYLGWPDPRARFGHVTFRDLLETSVHGDTHSDALLSLRLRRLKGDNLLVVQPIPQRGQAAELRSGPRGSRSWVRLTPEGVKVAKPIWERYMKLAEWLLEGVPQQDLDAHYRVNAMISARVKSRSVSYETLVGDLEASMAAADTQTPTS
jgi:hypothetical protein